MKKVQKILSLRPTQFAVGMLEVDEKVAIVRDYKPSQLRDYIKSNPVPVVVSPHDELYIVDHHHFLCVCYHLGIKKVRIKVVQDLSKSKMSFSQFWKRMRADKNLYPFCQFGEGPRKPLYLPRDIRGLADDPYRSLAWFVRKTGTFDNTDKNFAEFKWANFFRSKRLLDQHGMRGFAAALAKAVLLAQSPAAKKLPGYEQLNRAELAKVEKAKTKRTKLLRS